MIALLIALCAPAEAAEDAAVETDGDRVGWRLWSWTAAEGLPDDEAVSRLRAEELLRLDLRLPQGWRVDAIGAVREPAMPDESTEAEVYRLSVRGSVRGVRVGAGRIVRVGPLGLQHLDGLTVDAGPSRRLQISGWGGRLWHPETWEVEDTTVLGAELRGRPLPSGAFEAGFGWEARFSDGSLELGGLGHRAHGLLTVRDPNGARAALMFEVDPFTSADADGDDGLADESAEGSESVEDFPAARASLRAVAPLGRFVDLGATARWEGLAPDTTPVALLQPMDWLSDDPYAAVDGDLAVRFGDWTLKADGGPTLRPDTDEASLVGGTGRISASYRVIEPVTVGVTGTAAAAGDSWLAGGIAEARYEHGPVGVHADAGVFRFQPLAGPMADVWEARLGADARLPFFEDAGCCVRDLSLVAEAAAGSDRILQSWMRGGIAVRGLFGNMHEEAP